MRRNSSKQDWKLWGTYNMGKRNVILITIDALRRDFLGCYKYPKDTSPTIDDMARKGMLFDNAWANGPNTPHAFKSIMCGKYPLEDPGYSIFEKDRYLPYIFKNDGYCTIGIQAANPLLSRYYNYDTGFDIFVDFMDAQKNFKTSKRVPNKFLRKFKDIIKENLLRCGDLTYTAVLSTFYDFLHSTYNSDTEPGYSEVLEQLEAILHSNKHAVVKSKLFLWVHFMDVHFPYCKPKEMSDGQCLSIQSLIAFCQTRGRMANSKFSKSTLRKTRKMYEQSVRSVDTGVRELLAVLEQNGLFEDTTIFLLSDHGEYLGEHGRFQHRCSMFNELLRIPVIIYQPTDAMNFHICRNPISQRDIYQLILKSRNTNICKTESDCKCQRNEIISSTYTDKAGLMYTHADKHNLNLRTLDKNANELYSLVIRDRKLVYDSLTGNYVFYDLSDNPVAMNSEENNCMAMIMRLKQHISDVQAKRLVSKKRVALNKTIGELAGHLFHKSQV